VDNPWADLTASPPYVANLDRDLLTKERMERSDLKLNHLPVPWIGDPRRADVLLLQLNPGWTEDTDESETGEYVTENRKSLTFVSDVRSGALIRASPLRRVGKRHEVTNTGASGYASSAMRPVPKPFESVSRWSSSFHTTHTSTDRCRSSYHRRATRSSS
jgi:hypothetical protein